MPVSIKSSADSAHLEWFYNCCVTELGGAGIYACDFGANIVGFSRCGNQADIEIQQLLQSCFRRKGSRMNSSLIRVPSRAFAAK
jgi:hypothetical protein